MGITCHVQITSTLLILYSQDDNITSDALTRDMHLHVPMQLHVLYSKLWFHSAHVHRDDTI